MQRSSKLRLLYSNAKKMMPRRFWVLVRNRRVAKELLLLVIQSFLGKRYFKRCLTQSVIQELKEMRRKVNQSPSWLMSHQWRINRINRLALLSSGVVLALKPVRQLLVIASLRLVKIEIPFGHPCHSAIADSSRDFGRDIHARHSRATFMRDIPFASLRRKLREL